MSSCSDTGHLFVTLNNSFKISCDSWCLGGTAWWSGLVEDEGLSDKDRHENERIAALCEQIEVDGGCRRWEISKKANFFGCAGSGKARDKVVKGLHVPAAPEPGFTRAAVVGRGPDTTNSKPPVGIFTAVRVPKGVRDRGKELDWLMKSLEEYLVVAARWLCKPRNPLASDLWEATQCDAARVWECLFPGGELLTKERLRLSLEAALSASGAHKSLKEEEALEMMRSLKFDAGNRRQVDGEDMMRIKAEKETGITLAEMQEALYRGEPKRARRQNYLLAAPVVGTGSGGAWASAGKVVHKILKTLLEIVAGKANKWPKNTDGKPVSMDVVLVCVDRNIFSLAQNYRLEHFDKFFPESVLSTDPDKRCEWRAQAKELGESASSGKLAVFMGAGVSAGAGLPGWFAVLGMVERELETLLGKNTGTRLTLNMGDKTAVNGEWDPLRYASGLEAKFCDVSPEQYRATYPAPAGVPDEPDLSREAWSTLMFKERVLAQLNSPFHSLVHSLLAALPVDKMVTQNYDNLIEQACDSVDMFNSRRPYRKDMLSVLPLTPVPEGKRWLLKMHGTADVPKSIIITEDDYKGYEGASAALAGLVQGTMLTCHMFFIGFSGVDVNYKKILKAVKASKPEKDRDGMATLLTIVDEGMVHDPAVNRILFNEHRQIPQGARTQEIFVDLMALHAEAGSAQALLDPRLDSALSSGEKWLKRIVEKFEDEVKAGDAAVQSLSSYKEIQNLFLTLGSIKDERNSDIAAEPRRIDAEVMRKAMDVMSEEGLRLVLSHSQRAEYDDMEGNDMQDIAAFAEKTAIDYRKPGQELVSEELQQLSVARPGSPVEKARSSIKQVFEEHDKQGTGMISQFKLYVVLQGLDADVWTAARFRDLLEVLEVEGDNVIHHNKFFEWLDKN